MSEYQQLFDSFLDTMLEKGSLPFALPHLSKLCKFLRIVKMEAVRYESARHRLMGKSQVLSLYDDGGEYGEPLSYIHNDKTLIIANYFVYPAKDAAPWTDEETVRINRLAELLFVFNSRIKMLDMFIHSASYDDDGYFTLRYFLNDLSERISRHELQGKYTCAYVNLKHFAIVNQLIGRTLGSYVMKRYINEVTALAGDTALTARIGGDNFAMLIENRCLTDTLNALAGLNIVYDVESNEKIKVSATAGLYRISEDLTNADPVMDCIASASQIARNNGKEDFVYYNERLSVDKERLALIQQLFPSALENEEFLVYYQPKVSVNTGDIYGAEALCRWYHDGDIISPGDFIPALERSMDICKLDFYMLDHVCRDIRRWLDEGRKVVRISVNLSRKNMMDMSLLTHIIEIIDRNKVPHKYIEIELTETTTDVEFKDLKRVVSGLQQSGIYTSVDDFGIGYSSLNLLKEIPWDVLKVDRSFLPEKGSGDEQRRAVMFKYVVSMAKELGLECIAEGVETEHQVQILRDNCCELAQGFFFDRPLPVEEFEKKLR
ncbi:MAG: EAL domain-containing protein [Oscillospiraceae bacterium]|nr:EAL domain-containing protein [Oscillospiraceae bacterium]